MKLRERAWADDSGNRSWTNRFIQFLKARGRINDLGFFSTECYFYDDVASPASPKLRAAPIIVSNAFERWKTEGVPTNIPWYITEYGYSPFAGEPEVDLPGAILDADFVGHALYLGAAGAYFYGLEPNTVIREKTQYNSWGNLALWKSDGDRVIQAPFAAYYGARLVTKYWSQPGMRPVSLYPAMCDIVDTDGMPIVSAYAAHRPDGKWSLLILNKSSDKAYKVNLKFIDNNEARGYNGLVDLWQYSRKQYRWHANRENGFASPNLPPEHHRLDAGKLFELDLPAYSITVVSGLLK
jgi:hypothetical protein